MDMHGIGRRYLVVLLAAALFVAGVAAGAVGQSDKADVFTGCVNENSGVLRKVATGLEPARPCNGQEAPITWDRAEPALEGRIAALEAQVDDLEAQVEELEALTDQVDELRARLAGVSRSGDTLTFSGMNLEVLNGLGHTYTRNGLGNIIIGYSEDYGNDETRTGSHYLVVGRDHTYTRYGGIVVGYDNSATGSYASVAGGLHNTASGDHSSVTGGDGNVASGWSATVSGGRENAADGTASSVSGGYAATASGYRSSILGGHAPSVTWPYGIYPE